LKGSISSLLVLGWELHPLRFHVFDLLIHLLILALAHLHYYVSQFLKIGHPITFWFSFSENPNTALTMKAMNEVICASKITLRSGIETGCHENKMRKSMVVGLSYTQLKIHDKHM
jgi:hypothetical protein